MKLTELLATTTLKPLNDGLIKLDKLKQRPVSVVQRFSRNLQNMLILKMFSSLSK